MSLEDLFGKQQDYMPSFLTAIHTQRETLLEQLSALGRIGSTLDKFYELYKQDERAEISENIVIFTKETKFFSTNGYRYNRIFVSDAAVSDAAKITVTVGGVSWAVTLKAGENDLNMPEGAQYVGSTTSGNPFNAYLIRANK